MADGDLNLGVAILEAHFDDTKALREIDAAVKKIQGAADPARKGMQGLGAESSKALGAITSKSTGVNQAYRRIQQATDGTTRATQGLTRAATRMGDELTRSLSGGRVALSDFGGGMGKATVGAAALAGGIALAGAAIAKSVAEASAFEDELNKVATLGATTSEELQAMGREILAFDGTLGSAATNVQALYQALSAGIKASDGVDAVRNAAILAKASLTDTKTAMDAIAISMEVFKVSSLDAANALQATINVGRTTGEQLAPVFGNAAQAAKRLGLDIVDTTGAFAVMTRTMRTSTAADAFRELMSSIEKPSQEAVKALAQMTEQAGRTDLTFASLRRTLDEEGLIAFMRELQEVTGGAGTEIAKLFPNEGSRAALSSFLNDLDGAARLMAEQARQARLATTAQRAYEERTKGFREQLRGLKEDTLDLFRAAGGPMLDEAKGFVEFLQDVVAVAGAVPEALRRAQSAMVETGNKIAAMEGADDPNEIIGNIIHGLKEYWRGTTAPARFLLEQFEGLADKAREITDEVAVAVDNASRLEAALNSELPDLTPPKPKPTTGTPGEEPPDPELIKKQIAATQALAQARAEAARLAIQQATDTGDADALSIAYERLRVNMVAALNDGEKSAEQLRQEIENVNQAVNVEKAAALRGLADQLSDIKVQAAKLDLEEALDTGNAERAFKASAAKFNAEMEKLSRQKEDNVISTEKYDAAVQALAETMRDEGEKAMEAQRKKAAELSQELRDLQKESAELDLADAIERGDSVGALAAVSRQAALTEADLIALKDAGELTGERFELAMDNLKRTTAKKLGDTRRELDTFGTALEDLKDDIGDDFTRLFGEAIRTGELSDIWTDAIQSVWASVVSNLAGKLVIRPVVDLVTDTLLGGAGGSTSGITSLLFGSGASTALFGKDGVLGLLGIKGGLGGIGTELGLDLSGGIVGGAIDGLAGLGTALFGGGSVTGPAATSFATSIYAAETAGSALGTSLVAGLSTGLLGAAVASLPFVLMEVFDIFDPSRAEKDTAEVSKRLAATLRDEQIAAILGTSFESIGVQFNESVAQSIIDAPFRDLLDGNDLVRKFVIGEGLTISGGGERGQVDFDPFFGGEVIDLSQSALNGAQNEVIRGIFADGPGFNKSARAMEGETWLRALFGLDAVDQFGAKATTELVAQSERVARAVAGHRQIKSRQQTEEFVAVFSKQLIAIAEASGKSLEEVEAFFTSMEGQLGGQALVELENFETAMRSAFTIANDGDVSAAIDDTTAFFDLLKDRLLVVADVGPEALKGVENLPELMSRSKLGADEFYAIVRDIIHDNPQLAETLQPALEALTLAADEAERLRDALKQSFTDAAALSRDAALSFGMLGENLTGTEPLLAAAQRSLEALNEMRSGIGQDDFDVNAAADLLIQIDPQLTEEDRDRIRQELGDGSTITIDANIERLNDDAIRGQAAQNVLNQQLVGIGGALFDQIFPQIQEGGEEALQLAAGFIGQWMRDLERGGEAITDQTKLQFETWLYQIESATGKSREEILALFSPAELNQLIKKGLIEPINDAVEELPDDPLERAKVNAEGMGEALGLSEKEVAALAEKISIFDESMGTAAETADSLVDKFIAEGGLSPSVQGFIDELRTSGTDGTTALGDIETAAGTLNTKLGDTVGLGGDVGEAGEGAAGRFAGALANILNPKLDETIGKLQAIKLLQEETGAGGPGGGGGGGNPNSIGPKVIEFGDLTEVRSAAARLAAVVAPDRRPDIGASARDFLASAPTRALGPAADFERAVSSAVAGALPRDSQRDDGYMLVRVPRREAALGMWFELKEEQRRGRVGVERDGSFYAGPGAR